MKFSLTSAQQTFYTEKVTHDMPVWNHALSVMFPGQRSVEELTALLNEIIKENETFRLRFTKDKNGNVFQSIIDYEEKEFGFLNFENIKELDSFIQNLTDTPGLICENPYEFHIFRMPGKFGIMLRSHHILIDGFCVPLLIYKIQSKLGLAEKETKIYSYQRHIEDELLYKESKRFEKNIAFWNRTLSQDFSNALFDIGVSDFDYSSDEKTYSFSGDYVKQVKKICEKENIPFSSFIYAMFAVYVKRVLEFDDFSVGMPILNRITEDDMHTFGLYTHILPLIMHVSDEDTFISVLEKTYESVIGLLKNQKFTQYDIHNNCTFEKKNKPLFDVIVDYQPEYYLSDCEFKVFYANMLSTPLEIHFHEGKDDRLSVHVRYRTGIFRESNITDMCVCLEGILEAFAENPFALIGEASIESKYTLTEEEKQKLLYDFNDTAVEYPKDKCVQELFEERAEKTPDKTALIASDRTLTYRELNEEANKIAHSLIERGVGVGDIVAFALPRRSHLIAAMFGILKTGAAYLPVDPDYPQDRIEYILTDSGAKFFITENNIEELLDNGNSLNPDINVSGENICYCIYTSGSTGMPKGVLLKHKNVSNYVSGNANNVTGGIIRENCTSIVSVTSAGFDIFVTESLMPLVNGMTVVMANEKQSTVQRELNELLEKTPVDVLQTTPSKMKMLISNRAYTEYLKAMKVILIGGEAMDSSLAKELKEITDAEIYNIYGPTETTVWSSYAKIENGDITIGKPIANTQIYILDSHLDLVPIGVTGELCIAGDGVGAGYLNRPELTAEKFVDNPFGEGKLYKTGDLAYWREDGNIVYVGRNDFQVKVRGLRIELGEIENAITSIDGIENTAVIVRNDEAGRQLVCAFYTGVDMDAKEIRAHIGKKLPKYMLPHIFTHLEEMPLTSSGKTDRKALPEVDLENIETSVEYAEPRTEQEKLLVSAIETTLKAEKVGVNDNFFDLGGDSLKAIELTAILESKGYSVEIRKIFDSEDIAEIAESIKEKTAEEAPAEYGNVLAATSAQMRIYTAQMLDEGSTLYNIPYAFRTECVDEEKLEKAINRLVERHESLRTHFENRNGEIVQIIDEKAKVKVQKLESEDISDFIKPFDLEKAPLIHAGYYENTVMIDLHHIIADGESLPVFYRELNELYMGRTLNDIPVQYGEFAVRTGYTKENEEYWLGVFEDEVPTLDLNTDHPRKGERSFRGSNVYDRIDIELHKRIAEKCRALSVTSYVYYMAAFNILMSKYSTEEDVVVGTPASGRTAKYLETIGMFVNTLAVRNKPEGTKTVKEFLEEVRENSVKALDNQNYPFGTLVKKLGIEASGRNPLYDVTFAYESEKSTDIVFGDQRAELLTTPLNTAKNDLSFYIMPREEDVVLMAEYCTELFERNTINRYIASYKNILAELLNEEKYIKDISAFGEKSLQNEMSVSVGEKADFDKEATLYSLFESHARSNTSALCILDENRNITFGEFLSLTENLDSLIRSLVKEKNCIIGVYTDRSIEMYLSIYAIIRGGNAYMPIDVQQPAQRTDYMIKDSGAVLVLGQSKYRNRVKNAAFIDVTEFLNSKKYDAKILPPRAKAEDAAYVIYTSGTTGNPKGAVISHRSAVNRINWMNRKYQVDDKSVILQKTPYTFDVSVWEIFWWGMYGGKLAYSKPDEHFLPAKLIEEIVKKQVTHIHFVPSVFSVFLDFIEKNGINTDEFKSIRHIFLSGEALSAALVEKFYKMFGSFHIGLHNLYGPTECAVDVTYYDCKAQTESVIPIGKPIDNTTIYIMDKYGTPVPLGVQGEIYIGGLNVGKGYLNRPELTAERFVDDPFAKGKVYKTGDIGYIDKNGEIIFCGRKDTQIKINGQRIETDEIEYVISSLSGITSTAVLLKKINTSSYLAAFYSGKPYAAKELEAYCLQKLPRYMVPAVFVHVDEIPVNRNGKADKKALDLIDVKLEGEESQAQPPLNQTEEMICRAFSEILQLENINRNTDFISSGGSSLEIIQFVSDERFKNITVKDFIREPTPAGIAKKLLEDYNRDKFKYLSMLRTAEGSGKSVVVFPFAGGTAASFAHFAEKINSLADASVYFADFVHSEKECIEISKEIEALSETSEVVLYGHCVGAKLAIDIAGFAEDGGVNLKGIVAAGYVPQVGKNIASWKYVPYRIVKKILSNAKADFSSLPEETVKKIIKHFKLDTQFVSESFKTKKKKINTPIKVLLADNDPFTKKYKNPKGNYQTLSERLLSVEAFESNNHYFQNEKINLISETVKSFFES